MKKNFLIAIFILLAVIIIYLLINPTSNNPKKLMVISAVRYIQLQEYADQLNQALHEKTEKKKFELAANALLKVQQSLDSMHYLGVLLEDKKISTHILTGRLTVMSSNIQQYVLQLYDKQDLTPDQEERLKKDIRDAKMIVKTLNWKWIESGNYEEIKKAMPKITEYLVNAPLAND